MQVTIIGGKQIFISMYDYKSYIWHVLETASLTILCIENFQSLSYHIYIHVHVILLNLPHNYTIFNHI